MSETNRNPYALAQANIVYDPSVNTWGVHTGIVSQSQIYADKIVESEGTWDLIETVQTPGPPAGGYKKISLDSPIGTAVFSPSILNAKNSLNGRSTVKLGESVINVTQGYIFRENTQKHSTGIDLTTNHRQAVSIADGIITYVGVHGSKKPRKAFQKVNGKDMAAAGYYVDVTLPSGEIVQYMHLDPMTSQEMANLKGKKVKRGETIWGYGVGSGTMTGAHVKLRVKKKDKSGVYNHTDPTPYVLYGKNY